MMLLGLILLNLVLAMGANCVLAWTVHKLWGWFCASTLGAGPSIGAWWGITIIASLIMSINLINVQKTETKKSHTWEKPVGLVLGCLVTLAIAWLFGTILGWRA